ncbi:MAG TPA: anti-sigma factor [Gemmatimonadaceae bacterium]|nr:anti-sigma factor [Gemmatimonadaceae bacterium]
MTGTRVMTHDEANAELAGAALDALPPAELHAVLAHAAECATCGPELAALRESAAQLAYSAPPAQLHAARCAPMRQRLLARAAADRAPVPAAPAPDAASPVSDSLSLDSARARREARETASAAAPLPQSHHADRRDRWALGWIVAAAAAGAFVAAQAGLMRTRGERDAARAEAAAIRQDAGAQVRAETTALAAQVAERDRLLAQLTGPSVRVVELAAAGTRRPVARMFWDPATNGWTMFAHDLPAPRPGRTYQLWLVTASAKISAGTFVPGPNGAAVVHAEYTLAPNALKAIAVTDEPAGGVPQPTGPVVISGDAAS